MSSSDIFIAILSRKIYDVVVVSCCADVAEIHSGNLEAMKTHADSVLGTGAGGASEEPVLGSVAWWVKGGADAVFERHFCGV